MGCRECHTRRSSVSTMVHDLRMMARRAERETRMHGRPSERCLTGIVGTKVKLSEARAASASHDAECVVTETIAR